MNRSRRILVAFDGSPSSANALRQAMALSDFRECWMEILAVVPSHEGDLEPAGAKDPQGVMKGRIETLVEAAKEAGTAASREIVVRVEHGKPYEKIVEMADRENCDLVVMGRRGLRRLERMLMGSVTARVIAHSSRDVLVFPRDAAIALDHVVLATDGSPHSEAALEMAAALARPHGGSITAIAVAEMYPEFYADAPEVVETREAQAAAILERVASSARSSGLRLETRVLRGDPASEVAAYARENAAGAIFVGSRGRSGLTKLLLGSVAEKIIGLSHCPVFVAKLKPRDTSRTA